MKNRTKIYKFPSGATIVYRHFSAGNASAIYAGFHCGGEYGKNGLAHAFEHNLFKGTTNRSLEQILDDRNKVCFINAMTMPYFLCVTYYASNRKLAPGMEFASDVLFNATFDQDKIKDEIEVIKQEKARQMAISKQDIGFYHDSIFLSQRYKDIQDAANKDFGSDEYLDSLKSEDFLAFREKHFTKNKFIMFCCSTLPFFKIKRLCKKYFLDNIKNETKEEILDFKFYPIVANEGLNVIKNDNNTIKGIVTIRLDVPDPKVFIDDYSSSIVRWNLLLKPDLYFNKLREEGLIYHASAYFLNNMEKNVSFNFSFETSKTENLERIFSIIGDSVQALKTQGISSDDIKAYRYNWETEEDLPHSSTNESRLRSIIDAYQIFREDNPFFKRTRKMIRKLVYKANEASCNEFIRNMFNKDNSIYISVMGNIKSEELKKFETYKKLIFK